MAIDLGNAPTGTPPTTGEKTQMRLAIGLNLVDNTADSAKPVSTLQQTALDGKATTAQGAKADTAMQPGDDVLAVVTDATTARTLALADNRKYIRLTNAASCVITVPPTGSVAWVTDKTLIVFRIAAAGIPSITEGAGVTVNNKTALAGMAQHQTFALKYLGANAWDVI